MVVHLWILEHYDFIIHIPGVWKVFSYNVLTLNLHLILDGAILLRKCDTLYA